MRNQTHFLSVPASALERPHAHPQETGHKTRSQGILGLGDFWREEEGQTLVEYGLLISLIALVIVVAVTAFGRSMRNNLYGTANNGLPFGT